MRNPVTGATYAICLDGQCRSEVDERAFRLYEEPEPEIRDHRVLAILMIADHLSGARVDRRPLARCRYGSPFREYLP